MLCLVLCGAGLCVVGFSGNPTAMQPGDSLMPVLTATPLNWPFLGRRSVYVHVGVVWCGVQETERDDHSKSLRVVCSGLALCIA